MLVMYSVSYARVPESLMLLLSAIKKLIAMGIGFSRSSVWLLVGKNVHDYNEQILSD